jgi:hypothetical protein
MARHGGAVDQDVLAALVLEPLRLGEVQRQHVPGVYGHLEYLYGPDSGPQCPREPLARVHDHGHGQVHPRRLLVPLVREVQKVAVRYEQRVHHHEQVVRVPERVEPRREPLEWPRQLESASPERRRGEAMAMSSSISSPVHPSVPFTNHQ